MIGLLEPPGRIAGGEVRLKGQRIDNLPPEEMRKVRGTAHRHGVPGPADQPQPALPHRRPDHRDDPHALPTSRERKARERAIALLQEVGIQGARARIDSYPHEFSGGMRQRVVLALALCAEPELLIADEPTTALDVSIQAQIIPLLKRLCRERGTAVMLITHDMGVIAETADRVAVMYAGRIAEIGPVRDVVQRPHHPYTKGLMGAIPTHRRQSRPADADPRLACRGSTPSRRAAPSIRAARMPSPAAARAARADAGRSIAGRLLAASPRAGAGARA